MEEAMRRIFGLFVVVLFICACSTQKSAIKVNKNDKEVAADDSLEYGVETFDAKFKSWYEFYKAPSKHRSQAYYENWNRQYVDAWNLKCNTPPKRWNFDPVVGYDSAEYYGFELNHELFYYFMYVENVLKIPILEGGPKVPVY
jgi:hypothetical protein